MLISQGRRLQRQCFVIVRTFWAGGGIFRSDDFAVSLGRDGKDIDAAEGAACYDMNRHDINDQ